LGRKEQKPFYALNGFGVHLMKTTLTTKWFWLEIWGGKNKKKKLGGAQVSWGVRQKFLSLMDGP
jgi:hypothetical protein